MTIATATQMKIASLASDEPPLSIGSETPTTKDLRAYRASVVRQWIRTRGGTPKASPFNASGPGVTHLLFMDVNVTLLKSIAPFYARDKRTGQRLRYPDGPQKGSLIKLGGGSKRAPGEELERLKSLDPTRFANAAVDILAYTTPFHMRKAKLVPDGVRALKIANRDPKFGTFTVSARSGRRSTIHLDERLGAAGVRFDGHFFVNQPDLRRRMKFGANIRDDEKTALMMAAVIDAFGETQIKYVEVREDNGQNLPMAMQNLPPLFPHIHFELLGVARVLGYTRPRMHDFRPRPTTPKERLIVALDVADVSRATELIEALRDVVGTFKVGPILYTASGPMILDVIRRSGANTFVDLKLHDIPATVQGAVRELLTRRVSMLTVHALGGRKMLEAVNNELMRMTIVPGVPRTMCLAVTVLTSMGNDELSDLGLSGDLPRLVLRLAKLAVSAGASGIVASGQEVAMLRRELPESVAIVVPGIRGQEDTHNDQHRVMTPAHAIEAGADFLVVGRPICEARDPKGAAQRFLDAIDAAKGPPR